MCQPASRDAAALPRRAQSPPEPASQLNTDATEAAVLLHLLDLHPIQLTLAELVPEITDTPEDFASRDAVQQAVRQLIRTGLLHQHGAFLLPTRAALRALEL